MYKPLDTKPDFPSLEQEVQEYWQSHQVFEKSVQKREGNKPFIFFEGPPTANAAPGLHHVLARAFKDAICRFQTMRGRYVLRKAGWDTHGLPVELQIEKKLGISGKKQIESIVDDNKTASIAEFNKLCRESVWQYKEDWEKMTRRMGYWIDLENPYITYEPKYIETVWWLLSELWKKGLIYEGHKVVPYCPRCGTALSSHEVALGYEDVTESSVYVKFKLKPGQSIGGFETDGKTFILSWTTTPWTLPGNLALAVGANIDYEIVKDKKTDEKYIVSTQLRDKVFTDVKQTESAKVTAGIDVVAAVKGRDLLGLSYEPLFANSVPEDKINENTFKVYTADFVTTEDGTGIVHTAVMYGEEDYELGEKVGLPKVHTVGEDGHFLPGIPVVGGMYVKEKDTENHIFSYLKERNLLFKIAEHAHTYPHCWRCGSALLYYARNSWYIKMSQFRDELIKNNQQIHWEPEHIKEGRFGEWLREVKDWAISRERYWGTPLPFWRCGNENCGHIVVVGSFKELNERAYNIYPKTQHVVVDPHRPDIDNLHFNCEKCKDGIMERVPDVLDVWFDSGAMPYAQWHYPFENKEKIEKKHQFPADFICEAVDQTRGWFYTLHAISTVLGLGPAYKQAISLGHILDDKGQKMSKSKGNIVDPWEIFNSFGADSIRWYFFTVNRPGEAKLFKREDVAVVQRKLFNILANIYNYFSTYANTVQWESDESEKAGDSSEDVLDKWITARKKQLVSIVTQSTEDLNIFRAVRTIEDFVNDLSTWYVRRGRGREDNSFFATLYSSLVTISVLMAPFAPFFSDYIYRRLKNTDESVHWSDWPQVTDLNPDEKDLLAQMQEVRAAAELGNAVRKQEGLKLRQPLSAVYVTLKDKEVKWGDELKRVLLDELNVKEFNKTDSMVWREYADLKVGIDITVTPELAFEGDVRELERTIQALRKEAGLTVGQSAVLYYQVSEDHKKLIDSLDLKRLAITELKEGKKDELAKQAEVALREGTVWLGIKKS